MLKLKQRTIRTRPVRRGGGTSAARVRTPSAVLRESTGTDSRDEAQHVLAAYLTRARDEATSGLPNGTAFFAEAVVEYLGKKGEARFLDPLLTEFGKYRLRDITDQMLTVAGDRIYPGAKASTLVRQLYGPMQAVWNAAVAAKMAPPRLFAKPKVKYATAVAVTDQWLLKLLRAMPSLEQRTAILFMSFSGARSSEVVNVLVKHYNPVTASSSHRSHARTTTLARCYFRPSSTRRCSSCRWTIPRRRFSVTQVDSRSTGLSSAAALGRASPTSRRTRSVGTRSRPASSLMGTRSRRFKRRVGWRTIGVVAKTYGHLERSQVQNAVASVTTPLGTLLTQQDGC